MPTRSNMRFDITRLNVSNALPIVARFIFRFEWIADRQSHQQLEALSF